MMFLAETEPVFVTVATRPSRLLALVIDQVIGIAALFLHKQLALSIVGVLTWVLLVSLNIGQIIMVSTRGQTIGKMIMKIAIVDRIDKIPPGFVRAGVIRMAPMLAVSLFMPALTLPYLLIDGLPIFTSSRRCVHDYLAGTIVIKPSAGTNRLIA